MYTYEVKVAGKLAIALAVDAGKDVVSVFCGRLYLGDMVFSADCAPAKYIMHHP